MERRLMLSATIGAMPTVQVAMIDSSTLSRTFILGSLSPTDGGFIVINGSDSNGIVRAVNNNGIGVSGFADQDGTPLSLDYRWDLLNTGQAVGKPDLQQLYGDQSANLDIGTFNSWPTATLGIHPVLMTPVYAPGSELPTIGGSVATPAVHSSVEGGSISIGNLLTSVKQEQSNTAAEHGIVPASNIANELHHASHSNAAVASSIAGEWGRPATFETVGSERATGNRDDVDARHGVWPVDEPAAIEPGASADRMSQPKAAKIDANRTSMEDPLPPSREHDFGHRRAAGIVAATMSGEPTGPEIVRAMFAGSTGVASSDAAAAPIPIDRELGASVLASEIGQLRTAAFDEIGRTESLVPVWEKSRAAAALVAILAIERVAERNGRQVELESSDPASGKGEKRAVIRQRIRKLAGLGMR
jgi:hypothetical protein